MDRPDSCRICGGSLRLRYPGAAEPLTPAGFAPAVHRPGMHRDLYRCVACGTVQQPSLPDAEALHELYREMSDDQYLREEPGRRRAARRLLDQVARHSPAGRLLDVGSGYGLMLDEARTRGYEVLGIELSAAGVAYARDALGVQVLETSLEKAPLEPGSFDVITMTDVFEHLDDPVGALRRCAELLAQGGLLVVTTPDPSSLTARLAGRRWWSYLLAHRCLVPRGTMRLLVAQAGLERIEDRPYARVFSAGYWLAGLAERGGAAGRVIDAARRLLPRDLMVAAAMRDDWTYVARATADRPSRSLSASAGSSTSL